MFTSDVYPPHQDWEAKSPPIVSSRFYWLCYLRNTMGTINSQSNLPFLMRASNILVDSFEKNYMDTFTETKHSLSQDFLWIKVSSKFLS